MFIRRGAPRGTRFAALRLGLFFAGAGTWFAGAIAGRPSVTALAIVLVALAVILGIVDRPPPSTDEPGGEASPINAPANGDEAE